MIATYFNRIKHLRIAKNYVDDINSLLSMLDNYHHNKAIALVSKLTIKYENDINKIGLYSSARTVVKGEINELYGDHTIDNMIDDIEYLIECIVIIAVVNLKIEPDIETVVSKLSEE